MTGRETILVMGATGAQGGGVARHLLSDGKFAVRILTRNPGSEKAEALKKAGAAVIQGDLENLESVRGAAKGCAGVFGVTNYWEHFDKEYQHGKNLIDGVAAAGIKHLVFSSLPYAKKLSKGKLEVPHFDIKGRLEEYTRGLGAPATFVHVAFYFENFLHFFPPRKQEDGAFAFGFPQGDTPLGGLAVEDTGGVVTALFKRREEFLGKTVGIAGDDLPAKTYAEIMTRILGKKIVYNHIPREVFASFGFPGAEDLANMFEYNRLYIPNRKADVEQSRALYPKMQRFEPWLIANKERFQAILQA